MNDSLPMLRKAQLLLKENFDKTDHEILLYLYNIHSNKGKTNKVLGKYEESG